jgi:hypothetical protein
MRLSLARGERRESVGREITLNNAGSRTDAELMARRLDPARARSAAKRWKVRTSTAVARLRRQRRVVVLLTAALVSLCVVAVGTPAASQWCAREAFHRSEARPDGVGVSFWVPGVRCTLEYPNGHRAEVVWPVDA